MENLISLEQGIAMTTRYQELKGQLLNPDFPGKDILPTAETFNRTVFDKVLAHPDCVALRIYFSLNDENQLRSIIVGVNDKNEDILPTDPTSTNAGEDEIGIIEAGNVCPPYCPTTSPLIP